MALQQPMKPVRQTIGGLGNLMFKQAYLIGQMLDGNIPDVYVQGEKYWTKHKELIKATFSDDIVPSDYVALHIRRGDYLKTDFYVSLGETDYYKRAVEMFPNDRFLVFCKDNQGWDQDKGDRQWCRDYLDSFIKGRYDMIDKDSTEIEDMNRMAGCKHIIMANSSFSWWAAYLNPNKDKQIICPAKWFADGAQRTELMPDWILL